MNERKEEIKKQGEEESWKEMGKYRERKEERGQEKEGYNKKVEMEGLIQRNWKERNRLDRKSKRKN